MSALGAAVGAALNKYAPVAIGVAIGTAAKYGLTLNEGRRLTWRGLVGDLLLLGIIGLIALSAADLFNLSGNARVLMSAMCAVSSDRLVRMLKARFLSAAAQKLEQGVRAAVAADIAKVPAGSGLPDSMQVEVIRDEHPIGLILRKANRAPTKERVPDDQAALLKKLDDVD